MDVSRRSLLRSAVALGTVSALGIDLYGTPVWARSLKTTGTTLAKTILRGSPGAGGYAKLVAGPGEPHLVRTDLGIPAGAGRGKSREAVLAFAQISDVHIVDDQSPMRVEYTDRFEDKYMAGDPALGLLSSAYRPQEMLSAHIAESMVQAINKIGSGPVTGLPLAFTIQTGDNSDNSQFNEVRWNIDLLDGESVRPDSGDLTKYEGVADNNALYYDPHYWHPHPAPLGKAPDIAKSRWGYPTVPGLLDAARRPFDATGLAMPWYTAFGNHDGLVQGNFPKSTLLMMDLVATGNLKLITPPPGMSQTDLIDSIRTGGYLTLLTSLVLSPYVRTVSADAKRRLLSRKQVVEEHFDTTSSPVGHGFTEENRAKGTAYYTFDQGDVRFIVLDTVNPNGYAEGSLDKPQFDWLAATLAASTNKICVLASHHNIATMSNPLVLTGLDLNQRVLGDEIKALLLANPQVVAWVNGHSHKNQIWAHTRPEGGGFWEINTAAHIDWPQQSRIIEIADNGDGSLSIFATVIDHTAGPAWDGSTGSPLALASLARELSANDWQDRGDGARGQLADRNVELLVAKPAGVA